MLLLHLGLDQRVAGFVHDWIATEFLQLVVHDLGAFHFPDECSAGLSGKDLAAEDEQQHIAVDHVAVLIDRAYTIRVAIEGNAQLCFLFTDRLDQVREIRRHSGVGMMVWESFHPCRRRVLSPQHSAFPKADEL